jgi:putative nucleotidyltransferase with HDIG domain
MHPAIEKIREATSATEWEGRIWLVGGAVRDPLLGLPEPEDFDLVIEGNASEFASFLFDRNVASGPPIEYPRFGTALVRVERTNVEIVTARRESYVAESRKPSVEPATLEEDARRRDFTINTLLRNIHSGELRDPLGCGLADLQNKSLRTPLDPERTFFDDPLRMLRAVRFRWKLHFEPAPGLYEAIAAQRERLRVISAERIRDELVRMLVTSEADRCLDDLARLGLLDQFAPELVAMQGLEQGSYHHEDVWRHTLTVVRNVPPGDIVLALAALLHDVGKPATRSTDAKGAIRFFAHERVGAELAQALLERLRFDGKTIADVTQLVRNHMRLGGPMPMTKSAIRRLIRDLGPNLDRLLTLVDADVRALRKGIRKVDIAAIREQVMEVQRETPAERLRPPLTGREIMRLTGLPPGPEVGKLKAALLEEVLEGRIGPEDEEAARAFVLAMHSNPPKPAR